MIHSIISSPDVLTWLGVFWQSYVIDIPLLIKPGLIDSTETKQKNMLKIILLILRHVVDSYFDVQSL